MEEGILFGDTWFTTAFHEPAKSVIENSIIPLLKQDLGAPCHFNTLYRTCKQHGLVIQRKQVSDGSMFGSEHSYWVRPSTYRFDDEYAFVPFEDDMGILSTLKQ